MNKKIKRLTLLVLILSGRIFPTGDTISITYGTDRLEFSSSESPKGINLAQLCVAKFETFGTLEGNVFEPGVPVKVNGEDHFIKMDRETQEALTLGDLIDICMAKFNLAGNYAILKSGASQFIDDFRAEVRPVDTLDSSAPLGRVCKMNFYGFTLVEIGQDIIPVVCNYFRTHYFEREKTLKDVLAYLKEAYGLPNLIVTNADENRNIGEIGRSITCVLGRNVRNIEDNGFWIDTPDEVTVEEKFEQFDAQYNHILGILFPDGRSVELQAKMEFTIGQLKSTLRKLGFNPEDVQISAVNGTSIREVEGDLDRMSNYSNTIMRNPTLIQQDYRDVKFLTSTGNFAPKKDSYMNYVLFDIPCMDPQLRALDPLRLAAHCPQYGGGYSSIKWLPEEIEYLALTCVHLPITGQLRAGMEYTYVIGHYCPQTVTPLDLYMVSQDPNLGKKCIQLTSLLTSVWLEQCMILMKRVIDLNVNIRKIITEFLGTASEDDPDLKEVLEIDLKEVLEMSEGDIIKVAVGIFKSILGSEQKLWTLENLAEKGYVPAKLFTGIFSGSLRPGQRSWALRELERKGYIRS